MRNSFTKRYSTVPEKLKHIFRFFYAELTLNVSADRNYSIDDFVMRALFSNAPKMITELRYLNKGRQNDKFNVFFEQLKKVKEGMTAADARRNNVPNFN